MNKEYERVREEIAQIIKACATAPSMWLGFGKGYGVEIDPFADQILSIKGIGILRDDQTLPLVRNAVNKSYNDYMLGQEDMKEVGFVKVIKK